MATDGVATLASMRRFLALRGAPPELERVRDVTTSELVEALDALGVGVADATEVSRHWDDFRLDEEWLTLLAALVASVEAQRGDCDAPLAVWSDLDDLGTSGRFLYLYLFAICFPGISRYLVDAGVPGAIVDRTLGVLERHVEIHRRKFQTVGVDAGWWMLVTLRGEMLHVGSLQFHRQTLGVSTSSLVWYPDDEAARRGVGFRRGDPALGLHIPDGADLDPERVDETLTGARRVVGTVWPVAQRRLATCHSWLLDDRLSDALSPTSRLLAFQRRFTILPVWTDDDEDAIEFIFRRPGVALEDLPRTTSLERVVLQELEGGGHWRACVGWLDFDGLSDR